MEQRQKSPPATPFDEPAPPPPEFFPYGIYSVPEMSTVGMTEEEVRQRGIPTRVRVARFPRNFARPTSWASRPAS